MNQRYPTAQKPQILIKIAQSKQMRKALSIQGAPAPIGPYSQAIVVNDTCYVSGQIPVDPYTGDIYFDDVEKATHQVMKNIEALLQDGGFNFSDIVKCSIFLKSMDDFAKVNEVYASYFSAVPPARETVEVSKLPKGVPVEISCFAVKEG